MWLNRIFATFLILGGSLGYVKKGSLISFIAGGFSGFLMIYNAQDKQMSIFTSTTLCLVFLYRFIVGKKNMAAFISIFSAVVAVVNLPIFDF